jgi:hypothetical protein
MNYEKPNVALVASAIEAIKNDGKEDPVQPDNALVSTIGAYQADE